MRKILSIILIFVLLSGKVFTVFETKERDILLIEGNLCQNIQEKDIPTILIPGILASWYSEEGYKETGKQVKRWIPDPIAHTYDTLIYTFSKNGYKIKDVFYEDEFTISTSSLGVKYLGSNPKGGLYVFGYDWKKDNKITATLLTQLIGLILRDYEYHNKCNIGKVNIVSHSMGGLVARAMLEDMCVESGYQNGLMKIILRDDNNKITYFDSKKEVNGKIQKFDSYTCKNPYSSSTISKDIKVNKLITIATPHRGSPKTFPIWEKGDIEMTDGFIQGHALKTQLGVFSTDTGLYKTIHGYDDEVPNGIVTIGQLLPDIKNNNDYNNSLLYLYKDYPKESVLSSSSIQKYLVPYENSSKNSFLEELNKKENIDKMMKKIEKKYISYYSTITGNNGLNNIVNYSLRGKMTSEWGNYVRLPEDTYKHIGQDIYSKYNSNISDSYYYIDKIERNQYGLGGDGTVPTNNLKLVPNDSIDGKEYNNDNNKFESREIICYDKKPYGYGEISFYLTNQEYGEGSINNYILKDNEYYLYKGFGAIDKYQICSHTLMPTATSIKIVSFFLDKEIINERKQILTNFGKADYLYGGNKIYSINRGIKNKDFLWWLFDDSKYIKTITGSEINSYLNNSKRLSLDLVEGETINEYNILSPIDIMITDEQGRRIGIDRDTGMIVNEIPGAWTSGRAGESGEREFFLIPGKAGETINHKIETNSTGDGEYHIVLSSFDKDGKTTNSGVTIQGNAKLGFSENYEVVLSATGSKYLDLDDGLSLTLDVTKDFKTEADNIDIRYNVKGKGRENVDRISYILKDGQKIKGAEKIDGKIEIPLKEPGKYILELSLLDKDGNILKTENVNIEKIKNEKQEMEVKDILNIIFYKDIDLKLYKNSDFEILTNYDYLITSDQLKQNVTLTNGNGESTKFSIDKDFKYKSDNNNFEIISHNGTSLLFKETINNLGIVKIYKYNFIQNRIDEFEIIKGKNIQKINIKYNNNGNISEIKSKDNSLRFVYDNYTGKLIEITDFYENKIVFTYENLEILDIILNDELFDVNKLDLIRLDYKTIFSLKHKNNLQNIKTKLQSQNLDEKKKQKIIKLLEKSKEKYLKLAKYDITKKEIEYLVEEIKKILENLN